jgi:hypothetical protein
MIPDNFDAAYKRYVSNQNKLNELRAREAAAFQERFNFEKQLNLGTGSENNSESIGKLTNLRQQELRLREEVGNTEYESNRLYLEMNIAGCFRGKNHAERLLKELSAVQDREKNYARQAQNARDQIARNIALKLQAQHHEFIERLNQLILENVK